jgi:hypothetical protein
MAEIAIAENAKKALKREREYDDVLTSCCFALRKAVSNIASVGRRGEYGGKAAKPCGDPIPTWAAVAPGVGCEDLRRGMTSVKERWWRGRKEETDREKERVDRDRKKEKECVYERERVCVCVCMRERERRGQNVHCQECRPQAK